MCSTGKYASERSRDKVELTSTSIYLYGHCMVKMVSDHQKTRCLSGFICNGGGHEMRSKASPGLQRPIFQEHLSNSFSIVSRVFHFV